MEIGQNIPDKFFVINAIFPSYIQFQSKGLFV